MTLPLLDHEDLIDAVNRRRHRRASVLWSATLESGPEASQCVLLNIGVCGAMVRTDTPWTRTAPVTLLSRRFGEFTGRVVWRSGTVVGLQFQDHPMGVTQTLARAMPHFEVA